MNVSRDTVISAGKLFKHLWFKTLTKGGFECRLPPLTPAASVQNFKAYLALFLFSSMAMSSCSPISVPSRVWRKSLWKSLP